MASTKDYADFILEQLSGLNEITGRKMMANTSSITETKSLEESMTIGSWSNRQLRHERKCQMHHWSCRMMESNQCSWLTMWRIAIS